MNYLKECPLCSNPNLEPIHRDTDLKEPGARGEVPAEWGWADYAFCDRCGLIAARHRQEPASGAGFYERFKELEHRNYVTYPMPQEFIENQTTLAEGLFERAAAQLEGLVEPTILNIRSECGIVLDRFRKGLNTERVYALDLFEPNRRHAREVLGLRHVAELRIDKMTVPADWPQRYDLILANHVMTHALDLRESMAELRGLMNPDGIVLCYNEADHSQSLQRRNAYKRGINSFHKQLFDRKSFENLFRVSGMEVTPLRPLPGLRWAIPHASMIVIARQGAPPSELIGEHSAYRAIFKDWERRHEAGESSLLSLVKRRLKSLRGRGR
jgi:SAM-dependent methyltransferase